MSILLYHEGTDSTISTAARLGREQHPPRHYRAQGHYLVLDGPGHIVAHDADEICKIPGYRMATPQECDAYFASNQRGGTLHETRSPNEAMAEALTAQEQAHNHEDETFAPESDEPEQANDTTAPTRRGKRSK